MAQPRPRPVPIRFGLLPRVLRSANAEAEIFARNPYLSAALAEEQRVGRRIAEVGRITAVALIAPLLVVLNPSWTVLYYHAMLALFLVFGLLGRAYVKPGRSWRELGFIAADILLVAWSAAVPNPFETGDQPGAFALRWGTFQYFFVVLAFTALAHSWRTIWSVGITAVGVWLAMVLAVDLLGRDVPGLTAAAAATAAALGNPIFAPFLDLNDVQWNLRLSETVILVIVAGALTLKGWRTNQLILRQAEIAAERENLSRYFAPTIVDRLARAPAELLAPRSQEVAVMFVDLVGFTEFAETHGEAEVVAFLRRYYAEIERIVFDHGGTLEKYLGDGVMATFGTPVPEPGDAAGALRAARAVVAAVDGLGHRLRVPVGVHFGRATVGDVGPRRRLEFAVLGDTVNVAARLEAATCEAGGRIVISEALAARARAAGAERDLDGFAPRPGLILRSRGAAVDAWVLADAAPAAGPAPTAP